MELVMEKCSRCGLCQAVCVGGHLDLDKGEINEEDCIKCYHCMAVCKKEAIVDGDRKAYPVDEHRISADSFRNLTYGRKTVRDYQDKGIGDEVIAELADIVRYSPTATNCQEVFITVVRGDKRIKELSDLVMGFYERLISFINPVTKIFLSLFMGPDKIDKMRKSKGFVRRYKDGQNVLCYNAPAVFLFHSTKNSTMPGTDCDIASTFAMLHAETMGLGTCLNGFITKAMQHDKKIAGKFGIPKGHKVYASFLIGYPKREYPARVFREKNEVRVVE